MGIIYAGLGGEDILAHPDFKPYVGCLENPGDAFFALERMIVNELRSMIEGYSVMSTYMFSSSEFPDSAEVTPRLGAPKSAIVTSEEVKQLFSREKSLHSALKGEGICSIARIEPRINEEGWQHYGSLAISILNAKGLHTQVINP